jgi:hypothetical protein
MAKRRLVESQDLASGVIEVLDMLKAKGQLDNYLVDDDERKWAKLIYDILVNKFDMPFGSQTMQKAQEIFNTSVSNWRGRGKFQNMMNRPVGPGDPGITANPMSNESKTVNNKLIRLTESDLRNIVKESVKKIINENHFTGNMAHITEDDMINHEINNAKKILQLIDDWKEEKLSPEETVKQMEETIESLRMGLDIFRGASPKAKMKWPNTIGRG